MNTVETKDQSWTSQAGPRQTAKVETVLSAIRNQHRTYRELWGIIGVKEESMTFFSPFGGGCREDVKKAWTDLGEKFAWTITSENHQQIITEASAALEVLKANIPVAKDGRLTPEQNAEREAKIKENQAIQAAEQQKKDADNRRIKEEQTAALRQQYPWAKQDGSDHARGAANLKRLLSNLFPATTFKAKSDTYSGGSSIDVSWENGPTEKMVREHSDKFAYATFDGMTDSTNIKETGHWFRVWMGEAKYTSADRSVSIDVKVAIARALCEQYGKPYPEDWMTNYSEAAEELHRQVREICSETVIPTGNCKFNGLTLENSRWVCHWEVVGKPMAAKEFSPDNRPEGAIVRRNHEKNGVEIVFPGKPEAHIIADLKAAGFRWAFRDKLWYHRFNTENWQTAHNLAGVPLPTIWESDGTDGPALITLPSAEQAAQVA